MKKKLIAFCVLCLYMLNVQAQEIDVNAASEVFFIEGEVFQLINESRVANLLQPLKWSPSCAHVAYKHSLNMAKGVVPLGHEGVNERFDELIRKMASLTDFGETVAYNSGHSNPAQEAVDEWLGSPEYYDYIMGNYNHAGVGVVKELNGKYYFTLTFVMMNTDSLSVLEGMSQVFSHEQAYHPL